MSASERLKAMNETGRGRDVYPHLLNALPQIVAVVEAAELALAFDEVEVDLSAPVPPEVLEKSYALMKRLDAALATLDEALS